MPGSAVIGPAPSGSRSAAVGSGTAVAVSRVADAFRPVFLTAGAAFFAATGASSATGAVFLATGARRVRFGDPSPADDGSGSAGCSVARCCSAVTGVSSVEGVLSRAFRGTAVAADWGRCAAGTGSPPAESGSAVSSAPDRVTGEGASAAVRAAAGVPESAGAARLAGGVPESPVEAPGAACSAVVPGSAGEGSAAGRGRGVGGASAAGVGGWKTTVGAARRGRRGAGASLAAFSAAGSGAGGGLKVGRGERLRRALGAGSRRGGSLGGCSCIPMERSRGRDLAHDQDTVTGVGFDSRFAPGG